MFSKSDFIRRLAKQASRVAHLIAFDMDVDVHISEDDLIEDLEYRGYRAHVGC